MHQPTDHVPCHHTTEPVPVRVVPTPRYDRTPEGQTRLTFDTWVFVVWAVLVVLGVILV